MCIVTELVEGGTLGDWVHGRGKGGGRKRRRGKRAERFDGGGKEEREGGQENGEIEVNNVNNNDNNNDDNDNHMINGSNGVTPCRALSFLEMCSLLEDVAEGLLYLHKVCKLFDNFIVLILIIS